MDASQFRRDGEEPQTDGQRQPLQDESSWPRAVDAADFLGRVAAAVESSSEPPFLFMEQRVAGSCRCRGCNMQDAVWRNAQSSCENVVDGNGDALVPKPEAGCATERSRSARNAKDGCHDRPFVAGVVRWMQIIMRGWLV
eukprot:CAMPEP_0198116118 /NCGR_PEP_ID=MMETSP1442-20131203/9464_1 /TAXON_ID= /ORGANISM="Craspedostauros australis, Strain CCMP3328" /LENGTH=139 /DNA_ID=CAMNT_0043773817 /DNA_START=165 /DNA_END=581 /DNA_ORIENTATION=+